MIHLIFSLNAIGRTNQLTKSTKHDKYKNKQENNQLSLLKDIDEWNLEILEN